MKKVISIVLLMVMVLNLCACSGNQKSQGIELTKDNVSQFLDIRAIVVTDTSYEYSTKNFCKIEDGAWSKTFYSGFYAKAATYAVYSDYKYEDVSVRVKITGSTIAVGKALAYQGLDFDSKKTVEYELEVFIAPNISGQGEGYSTAFKLPINMVTDDRVLSDFKVEIIDAKGTVISP